MHTRTKIVLAAALVFTGAALLGLYASLVGVFG